MANMNFGVNLLPKTTNIYTLGNSDKKWNLYVNEINGTALASLIPDVSGFYTKPSGGIPSTDLADTYLTSHQNISHLAPKLDPEFENSISLSRTMNSTVGDNSVALGWGTEASGIAAVAVGYSTKATANYAYAEGYSTQANGVASHVEGNTNIANGIGSHAEGMVNKAIGRQQHVEGKYAVYDTAFDAWATGTSYAVGDRVTNSSSLYECIEAHTSDDFSTDSDKWEYVSYYDSTTSNFAHIIGNGNSSLRSNALAVDWAGNTFIHGDMYVNCNNYSDNGSKVATESYVTTAIGNISATSTPTANTISKYDSNAYLISTTPSSGDSSTKVATTAFVAGEISGFYTKPSGGIPSTDLADTYLTSVPTLVGATSSVAGTAGLVPAPTISDTGKFLCGDGTWAAISTMTGATSSVAGTSGLVPAPTTGDVDKFLAGDGTYKSGGLPMVILSYGNSTWQDFINAYNNNVIVYCRASSNSNPASGSQTRMAFMAYVSNADNPTNVEFQYYRSVNSHSATQMGDQVYIYKLDKTSGWSVTTREASIKEINVASGSKLGVSWSSNKVTLSNTMTAADMPMSSSDATTTKAAIDALDSNIATLSSQITMKNTLADIPDNLNDLTNGAYMGRPTTNNPFGSGGLGFFIAFKISNYVVQFAIDWASDHFYIRNKQDGSTWTGWNQIK